MPADIILATAASVVYVPLLQYYRRGHSKLGWQFAFFPAEEMWARGPRFNSHCLLLLVMVGKGQPLLYIFSNTSYLWCEYHKKTVIYGGGSVIHFPIVTQEAQGKIFVAPGREGQDQKQTNNEKSLIVAISFTIYRWL